MDALSVIDDFVAVHGEYRDKEAWGVLRAKLVESQKPSTNTARDEICPHWVNPSIEMHGYCRCKGKLSPVA